MARGVFDKFIDLFCSSFSRSQNAQFLKYVLTAFEKEDWKKLAQCFLRAAGMGENKVSWSRQVIPRQFLSVKLNSLPWPHCCLGRYHRCANHLKREKKCPQI